MSSREGQGIGEVEGPAALLQEQMEQIIIVEIKHAQDDNDFAVREGNNARTSWNAAGAVKGRREGGGGEQVGLGALIFIIRVQTSVVHSAKQQATGNEWKHEDLMIPMEMSLYGSGAGGVFVCFLERSSNGTMNFPRLR